MLISVHDLLDCHKAVSTLDFGLQTWLLWKLVRIAGAEERTDRQVALQRGEGGGASHQGSSAPSFSLVVKSSMQSLSLKKAFFWGLYSMLSCLSKSCPQQNIFSSQFCQFLPENRNYLTCDKATDADYQFRTMVLIIHFDLLIFLFSALCCCCCYCCHFAQTSGYEISGVNITTLGCRIYLDDSVIKVLLLDFGLPVKREIRSVCVGGKKNKNERVQKWLLIISLFHLRLFQPDSTPLLIVLEFWNVQIKLFRSLMKKNN